MDLKKVWENVLLETQGTVSAMTYDNWLSKTEAVCIADDELLVSADSDVTVNVVETRYTELLRECTKKVAPKIRNIKFVSPAEKSRYEGGRYISLEELKEICMKIPIPVVAIGGINYLNMMQLKDTGIAGVAVVSSLFAQDDIRTSAMTLKSVAMKTLENV